MAEIFKFFNSAPGDERWYFASDFADYFGNVLSSGLLHKDGTPNLQVKVVEGELKTRVDVGEALMQGYQYENTLPLTLEHGLPEPNLDRIDRIVLRLDKRNDARYIKLFVKQGESAVNPSPPQLQRDNYVHELSLAQVRVRKNTSSLNVADVKDERMIEDLCGIVYSLISVPTTVFQQQFDTWLADYKINNTTAWEAWQNQEKADFETWLDSIKDLLGEDVATKLATQIATVDDKLDQHIAQDNAHGIGDKTTLATPDKTTLVGAINSHVHDYIKHPAYAVTTGTNAYSVTLNPKPTKLEEGMGIVMKVGTNATANCTLNVNGMGAKAIMTPDGLYVNDLKSSGLYTVRYNGTSFILQGKGGGPDNDIVIKHILPWFNDANIVGFTNKNIIFYKEYDSTRNWYQVFDKFSFQFKKEVLDNEKKSIFAGGTRVISVKQSSQFFDLNLYDEEMYFIKTWKESGNFHSAYISDDYIYIYGRTYNTKEMYLKLYDINGILVRQKSKVSVPNLPFIPGSRFMVRDNKILLTATGYDLDVYDAFSLEIINTIPNTTGKPLLNNYLIDDCIMRSDLQNELIHVYKNNALVKTIAGNLGGISKNVVYGKKYYDVMGDGETRQVLVAMDKDLVVQRFFIANNGVIPTRNLIFDYTSTARVPTFIAYYDYIRSNFLLNDLGGGII